MHMGVVFFIFLYLFSFQKLYGIRRGDLVVNTLPNSPKRVVCEAGIMLSGAASVNGQCLMADGSDLLRTLRVSRAKAIVVDPDVSGSPWNVLRHHVTLGNDGIVTSSPSLPDLKKVYVVRRVEGRGPGDLLATLESRRSFFKADDVTPNDVITVMTTSGSTGFSKLVVSTHANYVRLNALNGALHDYSLKATLWILTWRPWAGSVEASST
jgi:acyl-coenzyme A synthetase/AMP-(fatty) acid ligase